VPKLNIQSLGSTVIRVSRVILGSTLLLSILCASIPASVPASGQLCTLACCAGRAPHAADSCMNGSCHAFLMSRLKTTHIQRQLPVRQSEQLCGIRRRTALTTAALLRESTTFTFSSAPVQSRGGYAPGAAKVSTTALSKPCNPDCGAGTFGSSSQSRPRDSGAASHADKPRALSTSLPEHFSLNAAKASDALCRRSRPRGPPVRSS
jgi:hypothetical protein